MYKLSSFYCFFAKQLPWPKHTKQKMTKSSASTMPTTATCSVCLLFNFLPHLSCMRTCSELLPDLVWRCKKNVLRLGQHTFSFMFCHHILLRSCRPVW